MVLDAIVEDPEMIWLDTTEDKTNHLTTLTSITPEELPHATSGIGERRTVRYFPDRLPIGIHLAGRGVVVYVVLDATLNDFRMFLDLHYHGVCPRSLVRNRPYRQGKSRGNRGQSDLPKLQHCNNHLQWRWWELPTATPSPWGTAPACWR